MKELILCALLIVLVVLDAMEDAMNRKPETAKKGHAAGTWFVGLFIVFALVWDPEMRYAGDWVGAFMSMCFGYIGFRVSLFNPIWNLFSGQKLTYLGETAWQDQVEKMYMPPWSFWITRIFAFAFGILLVYVNMHIYG
jgi:hypothetical protein